MGHNHSHQNNAQKNISIVFILNAVFVLIELVGGLLTNSVAILTDALHDFGDCLSLATAWFLQKKSNKARDHVYSYGYKRFSLLGSIFLSGVLTISSFFIIIEAIKRIASPQEVDSLGMFGIAIFGVVINGAAALKIKKGTSLNERSVYLHIMEDVLGWVAVLIVSVVMMFINLPILDPILSIIISVWVLSNVYKNVRGVFKILLQAVPDNVSTDQIIKEITKIKGVDAIHDLHIWSLDGESHVMTLHVVSTISGVDVKNKIISIAKIYHIKHVTIEFEVPNTICSTNCD